MLKRILVLLMVSGSVQAAGLDTQSRDILIQKFEKLRIELPKTDGSYSSIVLRLADLLSERARHTQNLEFSKGCEVCEGGEKDRKQAIALYTEILPTLASGQQNKVLLQLGNLHELQGDTAKAVRQYESSLLQSQDQALKAELLMALGELHFKKRQFKEAGQYFARALENAELKRKALASYRLSWCYYQDGRAADAITMAEKILKNPELQTTNPGLGVVSVDTQFKQEVSRDYATFLLRADIKVEDIEKLYELSENSTRLENIVYFASELGRLGQKTASIQAWEFVQGRQSGAQQKMETYAHLAQLYKDIGEKEKSVKALQQAVPLMAKIPNCRESSCPSIQTQLKNYIINWNKEEKLGASDDLVAAYKTYLEHFTDDAEMHVWLAQIEVQKNNYKSGYEHYKYATAAFKPGQPEYENALVKMLEVAELSGNADMLMVARQHYLQTSPQGDKKLAVEYQMAYDEYKQEKYAIAAQALRKIALSTDADASSRKIKIQAADLSLDALTFLKENKTIQTWAAEYSRSWPEKAAEYKSITLKAGFNEVADLSAQPAQEGLAWQHLLQIDLATATSDEKILYYKNKLILAEKLKKLSEARAAANDLLSIKTLSVEDRQFALARKAWLAELALDFKTALESTKLLSEKTISSSDKNLKLAVLASLAKEDASPYYRAYLTSGDDETKKIAMAVKLVRSSANPKKELQQQKKWLLKNPEVLADIMLDYSMFTELTNEAAVADTFAAEVARKQALMDGFDKVLALIQPHQINASRQNLLAASLKARVKHLTEMEVFLRKAVEQKDWGSQWLAVHHLAVESERFYNDVMSLPLPEGLTEEQQAEYLGLLSQQAAPYQLQAQELRTKEKEFWANTQATKQMLTRMQGQNANANAILQKELVKIQSIAPENVKTNLLVAEKTAEPSLNVDFKTIEMARSEVRSNPFSRESLNKLVELEKRSGNADMVAYLEGRIATLGTGPQ